MITIVGLGLLVVLGGLAFIAFRGNKKDVATATFFETSDGQEVKPNQKGVWPAISGNIVAGGEDEYSARNI